MTVAGFLSVVINVVVVASLTKMPGRPSTWPSVVVVVYTLPSELYMITEVSMVENIVIEGTIGTAVGLQ
jgi:hypothetical protein